MPPLDPRTTVDRILSASTLGECLALALAHLESEWEEIPYQARFRRTAHEDFRALYKPLEEILAREVEVVGDLKGALQGWLEILIEEGAKANLLWLLAYVAGADERLQPFSEVSDLRSMLQGRHSLEPWHVNLYLWDGPPSFLEALHDRVRERLEEKEGLMPLGFYRPRLQDQLFSLRFAASPFAGREVRFEEPLSYLTRQQFEDRWSEENPCLRLGLFSIRRPGEKPFVTHFVDTRELAKSIRGFRATSIEPTAEYLSRLEHILDVSSHPEHGVDILVLPELSINGEGLNLLQRQLGELAGRADRQTPLLTVAGSFHFEQEPGIWRNLCTVLDHRGHLAWTQAKAIPYPAFGAFSGTPESAGPTQVSIEDIEPSRELSIVPSPLGWLAVAICSDLVPFSTGGPTPLLFLPVDWVFVPSMSGVTDPFLEVGRELARTGKIFCFANAASALKPQDSPQALPERPPGVLRTLTPSVAAFINLPSMRPCGLWFDTIAKSPPGKPGATVAIEDDGSWEGLVLDLQDLRVVDASMTEG